MREQIAECAKRITDILSRNGEVNVLHLAERIGERSLIAYQALGWLAYQDRVRYERRGNQVFVSLGQDAESLGQILPDANS